MSRHRIFQQLIILGCSLLAAFSPGCSLQRKPNIVFILADDLGYRELGCFGQELIRTPNLDRLARQGMRLTQHYSGSPVCAPSRCVLMTGKHPGHAYIRSNKATPPEGQEPIPSAEITLPELLRTQGYVTGAFGKWGLGGPGSSGDPLRQGMDRFFGYNCQSHAHSYYPSYLWKDNQRIPLRNDPPVPGHAGLAPGDDPSDPRSYDRFKGPDYAPDRINGQALEFIRANRNRPFFLYYPTIIPHLALHVPDEELEPYLDLGWEDPPFWNWSAPPRPSRISGFEDWMPTLLELVGAPQAKPKKIDGISLAPTLLGRRQDPRPFLYREFPSYGGQQAVRVGDWKAVRQNMNDGNLEVELYHLAQDIGERNNIADRHPEVASELTALMEREHTPSRLFPLKPLDSPPSNSEAAKGVHLR